MKAGADVITTGNHVWDNKEARKFSINSNFLRPLNMLKVHLGKGYRNFLKKGKDLKWLNLMGNVFMKKCENVFVDCKKILKIQIR